MDLLSHSWDNFLLLMSSARALDPSALLLLAAVAREGGIRGGAAKLRVPRSTVSRRLVDLEETVGVRLVVRTARRFQMTDLGWALVHQGERIDEIVRASTELVHRSSVEPGGTLRVAVAPLLGEALLPEVLSEYLRRYPKVRVDLLLSAEYVDLRRSNIDVALRSGPIPDATDLFATRLGTSVTGHYASPGYLAARGTPRRPSDLADHDCIVVGGDGTTWMLRERQKDVAFDVNAHVRANDFHIARALAACGAGVVRLARFFAEDHVRAGTLAPVLEARWPRVPVFAVHTSVSPAPTKIAAFVALVRAAAPRILEE
jgi:DNA-binding transcriptional LysR family regulator